MKVQMDTSKNDNDEVKKMYADASRLMSEYKVKTFPSFLFFSPDGQIVHRDIGYKKPDDMIKLLKDAIDPATQYYSLLHNYRQGKMDYDSIPGLIELVVKLETRALADSIAEDYKKNYLYKLSYEQMYIKKNLEFMAKYVRRSDERAFDIFYRNADSVDKKMGTNYSQRIVDFVIAKEDIDPFLETAVNGGPAPDWGKITQTITGKYNIEYADRTILAAKIRWYSYKRDWPNIIKYKVENIDKNGVDTAGWIARTFLNNMVYSDIFMHSDDKEVLNKAIKWMELILEADPNDGGAIDTYANLLYKTGRTKEALDWQQKAVAMKPNDKEIQSNYDKMKKGEKTWDN